VHGATEPADVLSRPLPDGLPPGARDWFARRTYTARTWDEERIRELKGGTRVSVVLPARDESATVGEIVSAIRDALASGPAPVVDEIIVIDSHSSDGTARIAEKAGALVVHQDDVRPDLPPGRGKGDALWKSLAVATGDVAVFLDADVRDFTPRYVTGLLGPLLADARIAYVKGFYERPAARTADGPGAGGGRVTELVARPLLNLLRPELAGFVQPLAGEAAGRTDVLRRVPFATGYGVEIGLLLDLFDLVGLDRLAQVDLGVRRHRHQSLADLGAMAAQVHSAALRRLADGLPGIAPDGPDPVRHLVQYEHEDGAGLRARVREVPVAERPPHLPAAADAAERPVR